jgi:hypothetical protein
MTYPTIQLKIPYLIWPPHGNQTGLNYLVLTPQYVSQLQHLSFNPSTSSRLTSASCKPSPPNNPPTTIPFAFLNKYPPQRIERPMQPYGVSGIPSSNFKTAEWHNPKHLAFTTGVGKP